LEQTLNQIFLDQFMNTGMQNNVWTGFTGLLTYGLIDFFRVLVSQGSSFYAYFKSYNNGAFFLLHCCFAALPDKKFHCNS
jgi:hypothetical protein